ncbi:MFS transporter [Gilvimarinus sp. DA14]|uniref:MFS transporter n=1 Tax=Gilvimarinus sp. DA14 TaxID=2956798 RepID=UPI0020B6FBBA|nr:MFS transporter [Gilvimarinus sp. DA14]UTF60630.1 MFS transporter [Gilvimarinus sp. DA14]
MSLKVQPKQVHPWAGVCSMSLCVALLIAAEFMPVSLLSPMATSLQVSEGRVGQAVAISGLFAVFSSLFVTTLAGRWNRKSVLLGMTTLLFVSLVLMTVAVSVEALMLSRILLGICIGGFWSLATSVVMRLVAAHEVSRALAIMYSGQAFAAAFAAPMGSFLGAFVGWRGVFALLVPVVVINFIWQWRVLPSLPNAHALSVAALLSLFKRRYFVRGIAAVIFTFAGAFAMFTYLRPFLETVTKVDVNALSALFLVLGLAGFVGTWVSGKLAHRHAIGLIRFLPLGMALITLGLIFLGTSIGPTAVLLAIWGALNTTLSVAWMAWLSQNLDDVPEAAGSLMVAAIQAAILTGSALGGWVLDVRGIQATFLTAVLLCVAALLIIGPGRGLAKRASTL